MYFLDWDSAGRSQLIELLDPVSGAVLDQHSISSFATGRRLTWELTTSVQIRITKTAGPNAVLSGLFFDTPGNNQEEPPDPDPDPEAEATYLSTDISTQGNWKSQYGAAGFWIIGDWNALPSELQASTTGAAEHIWNYSTSDPAALLKQSSATSIAACRYATGTFDLHLSAATPKTLSLYLLDYDLSNRSQRIEIIDAASGAILDSRVVSDFEDGQYLRYLIDGDLTIRLTSVNGPNAVLSGIFIDPP